MPNVCTNLVGLKILNSKNVLKGPKEDKYSC